MRQKRLIFAIMALVLLFSAAPSALAAGTGNKWTTTVTGRTMMPTINVVVAAGTATLINPLSLPVVIDGSESSAQVISQPGYIVNLSDVPISVDVTLYGAIKTGSTMKLVSAPTMGAGSDKEAFLYFEMIQSDSGDADAAAWAEKYSFVDHIAIASEIITKNNFVTLPAQVSSGVAAQNGYALYHVAGDAVTAPNVEWSDTDGANVQVAFTFKPLPYDYS